jgi:hypothetical protein
VRKDRLPAYSLYQNSFYRAALLQHAGNYLTSTGKELAEINDGLYCPRESSDGIEVEEGRWFFDD